MTARLMAPGMCSCGKPLKECSELGWPHEWDWSLDDCVLCSTHWPLEHDGPYEAVRYGSGYAHRECVPS